MMRLLEWYLGLPAAGPGQGTAWGVRWGVPGWDDWPPWRMALVLATLAVGVVLIYRRDARVLPFRRQLPLMLLRIASLALLLVMLCRVTLTVRQTGLPTLAVMIDTSASMGLEDRYRDPQAAAAAKRLTAAQGETSSGRLDLVKGALLRDGGRLLRRLQESHQLRLFGFDAAASELTAQADAASGPHLLIEDLEADGEATSPAPAVRHVLDLLRGSPPTALLVFTDGITTTGPEDRLARAAHEARARSVPLILIGVGSDEPAKDVQLSDVLADDVVFADDPVTFAFKLKGYGYKGETARVTLRRRETPDVLDTAEIELDGTGQLLAGELSHVPAEGGDFEYVIQAEPLPGESTSENNTATVRVGVREERLRVLLVDRVARWEYRHLKPVLERDPAVELHTVLQEADAGYAEDDRTALARFPVDEEELFSYDVVIFGDVELAYLTPGALEHLRTFVVEEGGGLVLVAGERHNPRSYLGTPLEDLLPVEIFDRPPESNEPISTGFQPELTAAGRARAALRLADSATENQRVWSQLPPLYWLSESGQRKPGAEVLAVHPTRYGVGGPLPVIITQRYGAGQVIYHATDELWRWRERVEDLYYGRYWLQVVRYLSRTKLRSEGQPVQLTTDRNVYQQNDRVELRARFFDRRWLPGHDERAAAVVEGPGGVRESVSLTPLVEAPSVFVGSLHQLPIGTYHAWLSEPVVDVSGEGGTRERSAPGDGPMLPSVNFRVEASEGEFRDRLFRPAELAEAARASRGAYFPIWRVEEAVDSLPTGRSIPISAETRVPLWNRWEALVLLTALLAGEWILRKRCGLV